MIVRKLALALVAVIGAAWVAAPANAQAVERSRGTYHVAVCPHGNPAATARCHAHVVTDAQGNPHVSPNITPSGYSPSDLRSAYGITTDGSATIAIVDAYGYSNAESDLAKYRSQFGLPPCTTANGCFKKVNQNGQQGGYPRDDTGWAQESALDLDMASAMCPGCKLVLVEANNNSYANLAKAVNTAAGLADIISNSYGGGETGTASYASAYDQPGKVVTVSTGDSGYGVQFPASAPTVVAVGGTRLVHGSSWTESAWSGGGSGCSGVYAKPSWQTDSGCPNRMEADVSAVADPNTGVAVYGPINRRASGWLVFGGTSVSAPLVAGIYGVTGVTVDAANRLWTNHSSLHDIVSGSNGSCSVSYFCNAGPNYDGPTGNGAPKGTTAFQ